MKGKLAEKSLLADDDRFICRGCEEIMEVSWKMALEQMG